MEKIKLHKADSHIIACVQEVPEDPKGIVLVIHGFTSCKESATVQMLLRRLPAAGFGVIGIDLPGHGTEESALETLRVGGAIDSIETAEQYAVLEFPDLPICYFASSFGAYLTGLYISTRSHKGRKAFFRSAAVNMPALFIKENYTEKEKKQMEELTEKGYFETDMDLNRPVRVTKGLLDDFAKTDLFSLFDPNRFGEHFIHMAHGLQDDVIDPEEAKRFAQQFQIPITFFQGEGHSLSGCSSTPDKVADLAISLFSPGTFEKSAGKRKPGSVGQRIETALLHYKKPDQLPEKLSIGTFRQEPGFLGCFAYQGCWFLYDMDEHNNARITGPFSEDGIVCAMLKSLYIKQTEYQWSDEDQEHFLHGHFCSLEEVDDYLSKNR